MTALNAALAEAKQYLQSTDDPRNWSADQVMLRLLVAYVERESGVTDG